MAKLRCMVHFDPKTNKVVKTYQVLRVGPKDQVQFITNDSKPFIIITRNAQLVKRLGLQKAKNADGRNDLYQVPVPLGIVLSPITRQGPLKCGTLDKQGHFVIWKGAGLGPD